METSVSVRQRFNASRLSNPARKDDCIAVLTEENLVGTVVGLQKRASDGKHQQENNDSIPSLNELLGAIALTVAESCDVQSSKLCGKLRKIQRNMRKKASNVLHNQRQIFFKAKSASVQSTQRSRLVALIYRET